MAAECPEARATAAGAVEGVMEGAVTVPRAPRRRVVRSRVVGDSGRVSASSGQLPTLEQVDVDRADVVALERLPRIGPALAARIVADREARGAYGSVEALQRVRGIGPKLAGALRGHVTFSGIPRPSTVQR
ncbi:MAG: helix-hairpin-helix domain-containing protein [Gemmatimonadaceae bacterium]|nr:helix-hairpin-helix domain-containing protein [Gemmatimonadaceae bacterium]